jgi:cell division protein ZapA
MSKSDIDSLPPEAIEVTIFNQTYRLRSKTDEEHVRQIAQLVDERMRRISSQMTTHDVVKIAVLTALNIADEMQNLRTYYESEVQPLLSKLAEHQEEAVKEDENSAETAPAQPSSWFEDFFESKVETKQRAERLSSQVSAKLQALRQPSADQIGITSEDEVPEM